MERSDFVYRRYLRKAVLWALSLVAAGGCSQGPARVGYEPPLGEQRTFELKEIAPAQIPSGPAGVCRPDRFLTAK